MPYRNVQVLQAAQAKIESVRGTAETTMTRWITGIIGGLTWSYNQDLDSGKEMTRSYHGTRDSTLGVASSTLNFEANVTYEEAVWWLNLGLDGGNLAGVSDAGTPPAMTYTIEPDGGSDTLASATIKAGFVGGQVYRFRRCMVNKATFRFNPTAGGEANWRMAVEMIAIFDGPSTFDTITDLTRTKVLSRGTTLYLDDDGGTIGTTPLTGKLRSGNIVIDNQLEEKAFSENTDSMADDVGRGEQLITGEFLMEFTDDTEFAHRRAADKRLIRIEQVGPEINAGPPAATYLWRWDIYSAVYSTATPQFSGQNFTITLGWIAEWSAAHPEVVTATIVNEEATITA